MSAIHLTQDLLGKPVISIVNGNVLARLQDVLVSPDMRQIAAAVTSDGGTAHRGLGYGLPKVLIEGAIADSRQVPAGAFCMLQSDVLVVDESRIE